MYRLVSVRGGEFLKVVKLDFVQVKEAVSITVSSLLTAYSQTPVG